MNKRTKISFFSFLLIFAVSFSAIAQNTDLKDIQKNVSKFSEDLAKSLPFNSMLGLNWADVYIGKLFPGKPPHLGVGGSFGVTTIDSRAMLSLAKSLNGDIPYKYSKLPLPAYTIETRIGGFILPFDIGFKFGYLPKSEIFGINTNYLLIGGDIRYAVLDKPVPPKISVGIGFNYLEGGIGAKIGPNQPLKYGGNTIVLNSPNMELTWASYTLDLKAQISKTFSIVTPYFGLGLSYAWSEAGYSIKTKVTKDGINSIDDIDIQSINGYLENNGMDPIDVNQNGISSTIENSSVGLRAFGGTSFNLKLFKIDLTVLYSILDTNFGGSLGFRFQL